MNDVIPVSSPLSAPGANDAAAEIASLAPWAQNITLPDGSQTAPQAPAAQARATWEKFRDFLPADLSRCSALDIGSGAGFFAVELARRGSHVTAVEHNAHALRQAQWVIDQHEFSGRIDLYRGRVYDLARWRGRHGVVLFLGQLHTLRYPQLALDIATQLAQRCLVLEIPSLPPGSDDLPGWWKPDALTIEFMLRLADFEIVARPSASLYICQRRLPDVSRSMRRSEDEFLSATGTMPIGLHRYADDTPPVPRAIAPLSIVGS